MERKCSCGGIDIGVGVMHEPYCELNDAGHITILEARICELEVERASVTDFANIFAREFGVEEVTDARKLKILLDRLWERAISMRKELMTPMYFKTLEMEKERDEARNLVTELKIEIMELKKEIIELQKERNQLQTREEWICTECNEVYSYESVRVFGSSFHLACPKCGRFPRTKREYDLTNAQVIIDKLKSKNIELLRILGSQTKSNIVQMVDKLKQEE